jgi:hypothetical protein
VLPGARVGRMLMILVAVIVILGLVMSSFAMPAA